MASVAIKVLAAPCDKCPFKAYAELLARQVPTSRLEMVA